ncbi:methyltransferase [Halogeometricum sp. S1BR25-6]|uniref:Methyltransferase n=1 Tax=Halogeometricum salsisoli TaxID=2950536 RepID=A0ABU2GBQ9_9EURY|nr:methyltransferase [Halogeometricum sp. S1BR25-6]MDS0297906.1 methyltransferase [Halogeometricum sp. S1BR25-6]
MPLNPNFLERLVLFRLNKGPAPMLDLFGAASFESVSLALELGLFESLAGAEAPLTAAALADRLDAHPDGLATLCNFLVAEGYLTTEEDGYRLTGMTETWLLAASETDMGPWLAFWNDLVFPFWERELETAVREGEPSRSIYEWFDEQPGRWEVAQAGFRAAASLLVDDVVDAVTVPGGSTRLIDVGGGHGLYAVELCRRHPNLSATVFDLPGAVAAVDDEIPDAVADQVSTRAGDYRTDDLGDGYDVALLFNIIHAHDPTENTALFERVADSLAPGGRIIVLDQWEGSGRTSVSRAGLRFVALTYLTTLGATVYAHEEVTSWLRDAGFGDVTRRSVGPLSGLALVEATKR